MVVGGAGVRGTRHAGTRGHLVLCQFSENQFRDSDPLLSEPKKKIYKLIKQSN